MSGQHGTGETRYAFLLPDMKDCDGDEPDASPAALSWLLRRSTPRGPLRTWQK